MLNENISNNVNYTTRKNKYHINIFPDGLERILFSRMDPIVKNIRSQANLICRNYINENFIHKAFNKFNYGYYYKDINNTIIGFCIWKERKELISSDINELKYISVLLICAQPTDYKLGKIMLFDIESYGLMRKFHRIQLQALNLDIVSYYESNGYKIIDSEITLMEKTIRVFRINKHPDCSKTRRSKIQK